ncbi:Hypothetical_protein [Hexamita inflata]|uniref:Hypothetical_protein n=1 Tax=Hexamita inflata TaxID=28002 RepID=A0AA86PF73_9EUKA|nr:Hypothetical protein HINF_LOCUS25925 [Hexamita inflata]
MGCGSSKLQDTNTTILISSRQNEPDLASSKSFQYQDNALAQSCTRHTTMDLVELDNTQQSLLPCNNSDLISKIKQQLPKASVQCQSDFFMDQNLLLCGRFINLLDDLRFSSEGSKTHYLLNLVFNLNRRKYLHQKSIFVNLTFRKQKKCQQLKQILTQLNTQCELLRINQIRQYKKKLDSFNDLKNRALKGKIVQIQFGDEEKEEAQMWDLEAEIF